jgi:hypothetical protein
MALSTDGRTLYPSLEAALLDDPLRQRRVVYAFDVATQRFLPQTADLMLSDGTAAIGDLTAAGKNSLLVIERDNGQGEAALAKRIALVDISNFSGTLPSTPLVDLLSLANPKGIGGPATSDTVGLGSPFGFPFVTIESLLVKNPRTLVVANDNNFPSPAGAAPARRTTTRSSRSGSRGRCRAAGSPAGRDSRAGRSVAGAQQPSPRQASRPSFAAMAAMSSPATGSAHHQPSVAFSPSPTSRTALM